MKSQEFHNLNDPEDGIHRELAAGVSARIFVGDRAMLSIVTLEPQAKGEVHQHPEEQWGILLEGDGVRTQGEEEIAVIAGDFWRTPGDVPHAFRAGPNGARLLDMFSPPREQYKTVGSGVR